LRRNYRRTMLLIKYEISNYIVDIFAVNTSVCVDREYDSGQERNFIRMKKLSAAQRKMRENIAALRKNYGGCMWNT
jgi:hypothetical protein